MSLRICVIGCGYMATNGHGPAYRKYKELDPEIELVACCDEDESRASAFKKEFGFKKHYTDIDTMLDEERPDAVCLFVPVQLTFPLSVKIMRRGIPLLLEKPPGLNRFETTEMIRTADESGVPNQVAFNRRYIPLVQRLKQMLDKDVKGNELSIRYKMMRVGRTESDFSTTAIHGIDVVRYLAASDYSHVRFTYQELPHVGNGVANIFLDCTFKSGAIARLSFCPVSGTFVERIEASNCGNTYFLDLPIAGSVDLPGRLLHFENGKPVLDINGKDVSGCSDIFILSGFYSENVSFFEDLKNGKIPSSNIASGLQSVEIADCIRKRSGEYRASAF